MILGVAPFEHDHFAEISHQETARLQVAVNDLSRIGQRVRSADADEGHRRRGDMTDYRGPLTWRIPVVIGPSVMAGECVVLTHL